MCYLVSGCRFCVGGITVRVKCVVKGDVPHEFGVFASMFNKEHFLQQVMAAPVFLFLPTLQYCWKTGHSSHQSPFCDVPDVWKVTFGYFSELLKLVLSMRGFLFSFYTQSCRCHCFFFFIRRVDWCALRVALIQSYWINPFSPPHLSSLTSMPSLTECPEAK